MRSARARQRRRGRLARADQPPRSHHLRQQLADRRWRRSLRASPRLARGPQWPRLARHQRRGLAGDRAGCRAALRDGRRNLDSGGFEGLDIQQADSDTFALDDADGTQQSSGCNYGSDDADTVVARRCCDRARGDHQTSHSTSVGVLLQRVFAVDIMTCPLGVLGQSIWRARQYRENEAHVTLSSSATHE